MVSVRSSVEDSCRRNVISSHAGELFSVSPLSCVLVACRMETSDKNSSPMLTTNVPESSSFLSSSFLSSFSTGLVLLFCFRYREATKIPPANAKNATVPDMDAIHLVLLSVSALNTPLGSFTFPVPEGSSPTCAASSSYIVSESSSISYCANSALTMTVFMVSELTNSSTRAVAVALLKSANSAAVGAPTSNATTISETTVASLLRRDRSLLDIS
mmetsp:Transcript_936/g.1299  ORF Transcript_936/g.1299 Transcript_936/m.1299 type:complete len:215 (-) Transcript_936:723-1367(-)